MPGSVKVPSTLEGGAASRWRSTFLSAYDGTCADRSDRDACAAKIAWSSVKQGYRKGKDGQWVSKAEDAAVGPVSPAPDLETTIPLYGTGELEKGEGTKAQRWKLAFARALANECRNADHPVECARAKANAAVGELEDRDMTGAETVERKDYNTEQRRKMAKAGTAMPDGSFPIADCNDVTNALRSLGRTSKPQAKVISHIRSRAKSLGCKMTPALQQKMEAIERYIARSEERQKLNVVDFQHIAALGETPIVRPDRYSSATWRSLAANQRTVKAEAIRRIIERNYAQAVEDAEMTGWKPRRSHYDPEEYFFNKQWLTGDPNAPQVTIRSILVRSADSLDWHLRPISSFASGTLAEKMPAGIVRHASRYMTIAPMTFRGGPGSGHFGHEGRPGEVGGSEPGDAASGEAGRQLGKGPRPDSDAATAENQAEGQEAPPQLSEQVKEMSLSEIARIIRKDWGKVNYAAVPYLEAMGGLENINQDYFMDSGASVVAYFLSNANSWRGDTARTVKAELNRRLKTVYG